MAISRNWFAASSVTQALPQIRRAKVFGDPEFRQATSVWSACMVARGLHYTDPGRAALAFPRESGTPSAEEVRTAVAEVDCAASSSLGDVAGRLDQTYGKEVTHTYQVYLDAVWRIERKALPLARRILAEPPPAAP